VRDWRSLMLELQPGLTVAAWKASVSATALSPEIIDLYVGGLRKAGFPEE
jgi:hypothetical protein